eukprot:8647944-Karenia_brevis.AAC.1
MQTRETPTMAIVMPTNPVLATDPRLREVVEMVDLLMTKMRAMMKTTMTTTIMMKGEEGEEEEE